MGAFVPVANVAEFAVVQQLFGQNVINVWHIKREGGWDSDSLANMSVALISGYNDHLAANQSSLLQYVVVRGRDLTTQNGAVSEINFPPNSGGDINNMNTVGTLAACVKHTTGLAGRSFRGRTYVGGIPENRINGGFLDAGYCDSLVAAFDAIDGLILGSGGTWGVVSKYSGYTQTPPKYKKVPTPRAAGIFTDIINNSCDNVPDTMRSRAVQHGS